MSHSASSLKPSATKFISDDSHPFFPWRAWGGVGTSQVSDVFLQLLNCYDSQINIVLSCSNHCQILLLNFLNPKKTISSPSHSFQMPQECFLWCKAFVQRVRLLRGRLTLHTGKSFNKPLTSSSVSLQSFKISNSNSLITFVRPCPRLITHCYFCDLVQPSPSSSSSTSRGTCHPTKTTCRPSPKRNPALKSWLLRKKQCVLWDQSWIY